MVHGRPFLFRIPTKETVVVVYSTLSPQKCTKLNTEKQHAQGHRGSNLTPERENRNFRKTLITNSTKPLCRPRGHMS
jgi:hypothetical protein